jgi:hypothetical protein
MPTCRITRFALRQLAFGALQFLILLPLITVNQPSFNSYQELCKARVQAASGSAGGTLRVTWGKDFCAVGRRGIRADESVGEVKFGHHLCPGLATALVGESNLLLSSFTSVGSAIGLYLALNS